ncbi:uncharacterized protein (TIGR02598 family) [Prosthecobacter fusiformis]|uniref:Uncharacterized protein (TIGR02598 family) n=1 Tax=Prosthecobacter fusiformis TaxID=48464 RepID=A0A4R7RW78_9BACT|nr:prepilin-type N-terminal cleavage/methylation domain-containing protein [Prosthecobacter fusiformis]TDU69258.1 uncharacterized protein (TIGR02598 family) [Prosthecobacter fusiformis]
MNFSRTALAKIASTRRAGFSLTEIMFALALVAGSALPVLGLLSVGLLDAKEAGDHRLTANLRNTVHQLLCDPAWPAEAVATGEWDAIRYFDDQGRMIENARKEEAAVIMRMKSLPGMGYQSDWLETVQVTFQSGDREDIVTRTLVQRRKKPQG